MNRSVSVAYLAGLARRETLEKELNRARPGIHSRVKAARIPEDRTTDSRTNRAWRYAKSVTRTPEEAELVFRGAIWGLGREDIT